VVSSTRFQSLTVIATLASLASTMYDM